MKKGFNPLPFDVYLPAGEQGKRLWNIGIVE